MTPVLPGPERLLRTARDRLERGANDITGRGVVHAGEQAVPARVGDQIAAARVAAEVGEEHLAQFQDAAAGAVDPREAARIVDAGAGDRVPHFRGRDEHTDKGNKGYDRRRRGATTMSHSVDIIISLIVNDDVPADVLQRATATATAAVQAQLPHEAAVIASDVRNVQNASGLRA